MSEFRVAVIDPSLFTIPYDSALCDALSDAGAQVTLYGRRVRPFETYAARTPVTPLFYRASERLRGRLPAKAVRIVKGIEHAADMWRLQERLHRSVEAIHFQWAPLPLVDQRFISRMRKSAPCVLTVHDVTPFNGSGSSVMASGFYEVLGEFEKLIVHSENGRATLIARGVAADKIEVIPHGILKVKPPAAESIKRMGTTNILMFGKVKTYKGVDVMIEALGLLSPAMRRTVRVQIVGEATIPVEPLQRRAAELGVDDVLNWDLRFVSEAEMGVVLSQADIFAFPYREIDASGVFMSCVPYGKPIIASQIGAFDKLLTDGVHGRLVPPEQPAALADALADLLSHPYECESYGRNVAALGDAIPSWDEIAQRTLAVYRNLR